MKIWPSTFIYYFLLFPPVEINNCGDLFKYGNKYKWKFTRLLKIALPSFTQDLIDILIAVAIQGRSEQIEK